MSNGNWYKRPWIDIVVAAIVTLIFLVGGLVAMRLGFLEQAKYHRNAEQNSAEYTRNTYAPEVDRCLILPREAQSDCIAEASNKERNYRRDEQDLAAQRTSAIWAYLMGSAALIGMILSAFGVFLVWRTFRATRDANNIARDIGEAQTRAYIRINTPQGLPTAVHLLGPFGVEIGISNYGETPAKNCCIKSQIFLAEFPLAVSHILPDGWRDVGLGVVIHRESSDNIAAHGAGLTPQQIQSCVTFLSPIRLYFAVRVDYVDTYGRPHVEQACFSANYNDEKNRAEHANLHSIST